MPEGIIIIKVDRVPDSCLDCEMHDDALWCPFAGEHVEIYANKCKKNPRCPIKPMKEINAEMEQAISHIRAVKCACEAVQVEAMCENG